MFGIFYFWPYNKEQYIISLLLFCGNSRFRARVVDDVINYYDVLSNFTVAYVTRLFLE